MRKLKIVLAVLMLSCMLVLGNPGTVSAVSRYETPPAIVLVQDRNNKMLLKHNFIFDDGMLVPGGSANDDGFWVPMP
ncbi:MAG: hypothetical protein N2484_12965 [Clostridia bacterium]|nr:hypothetical protein [Clostridia bacterium]